MRGTTREVLVVGAGPVGLTMAAELARHGLGVRIVDKAAEPSDKSKALAIWPRTLEMLADMGVVDAFLAAGLRVHAVGMWAGAEQRVRVPFDAVASPYPFALMLAQSATERLLAAYGATRGLAVERDVELAGFTADTGGVRVVLRHPDGREEATTVGWLVGCDGAHSIVRHGLGIAFAGTAEPSDWMLADVHLGGAFPRDEVSIYWSDEGVFAIFPITTDRVRVIADLGPSAGGSVAPSPTLAEVQAIVERRGPGGLRVSDPVWLAGFRINERKVADYRAGRVFLAGDAAHIHSPAGGQGMNTGMQDAYNLGWKLALAARGRARPVLLDSYSTERSAVGDEVLRNAAALTQLATLRHPVARRIRDRVVPLVAATTLVQDRIRATVTELAIHYRRSPIVRDDRGFALGRLLGTAVLAGDRMPDARLADAATGTETRLFTMLAGTRHVLLVLGGAAALGKASAAVAGTYDELVDVRLVLPPDPTPATADTAGALRDLDGTLRAILDAAAPLFVLVRPDGYIGFCGPADATVLRAHLAGHLEPRETAGA